MRLRLISSTVALMAALGACAAAAPVAAPASARTAALDSFYSQTLDWSPCKGKLECASFRVPLDYAKPQGAVLTIMAARASATGTSRGALVVNPGGPGGSGIEYIKEPAYAISSTARRNFDLVSFDPRGVGESTPLWCLRGAQLDKFLNADPTPDTPAEERAVLAWGGTLAKACQRENAPLMAHVSAADIARDMDVLRALLGEQKLRYVGKSWGTVLGKVYAALFPEHVGSFVLDGAVDLEIASTQAALDQGAGFEDALNRFAAWCANRTSCPLGKTTQAVKSAIIDVVHRADRKPLPTLKPSRPLTEAQAITAIIGPLYLSEGGREWLLTGLTPAVTLHNGGALQTIFDWFVERNANGTYSSNANTAIYFMNCLDDPGNVRTISKARALARSWSKRLPFLGATMAWSELPCARWPVRAGIDIAKLRVRDVPPMLVIGGTHDPATPLKWAKAMAQQIPGSILLTRDGDGHTSYANGVPCIDKAVDAFLLSDDPQHPTLPEKGTVCDGTAA